MNASYAPVRRRVVSVMLCAALLATFAPATPIAIAADLVTANAGPDLLVDAASVVSLTGSGSTTTPDVVSFHWRQVSGPSVTLASPDADKTTFVAPLVDDEVDLTFELSVQAGAVAATDQVKVTVLPSPDPPAAVLTQSAYPKAANPDMDKSDGRIYAVWSDAGAAYFARRDVGEGTFSPPMQIPAPGAQAWWAASAPQVASRDATVAVAFEAYFYHSSPDGVVLATEVVLATSSDHGATFTTRRLTPTNDAYAAHSPKLAITADGRIHLVYRLQTLTGMAGEMRAQSAVWDAGSFVARDLDDYVPSLGEVYDVAAAGNTAGIVYQTGPNVRLRTVRPGADVPDRQLNAAAGARNPKIAGLPNLLTVAWEQAVERPMPPGGPGSNPVAHEVLTRFVGADGTLYGTGNRSLSPDVDSTDIQLAAFDGNIAVGWLEGSIESAPNRVLRIATTGRPGSDEVYEFNESVELAHVSGAPGQERHRLAISGDGATVHVAWSNAEPGVSRRQIYLAESSDEGLTFAKRKQISDLPVGCFNAVVETEGSIWSSVWASGESWSLTQRVGVMYARSGGFSHDIALTGVQVVQAPYGSDALVRDHLASVRALVYNGNPTEQNVVFRLEASQPTKGGDAIDDVFESVQALPAASTTEILLPEQGLGLGGTALRVRVTMAPSDATANNNESNDSTQTPLMPITRTRIIRVGYSPLNLPGDTTMTAEQVDTWSVASHLVVRGMFPVPVGSSADYPSLPSVISSDTLSTGGALTKVPESPADPMLTDDQLAMVWRDLATAAILSNLDMVVGITDGDFFAKRMGKNYLGLAPWSVPPATRYPAGLLRRSEAGKATVPHEIAHTYGLVSGPYMGQGLTGQPGITDANLSAHTGIRAPGYWPGKNKRFPASTWDLMYPFGAWGNPHWISAPMWETLFDIFRHPVQDPPVIMVNGRITSDDVITLDTWYRVDSVYDVELGDTGSVTVEYRDAGGDPIAQTAFTPAFATTGWDESPATVAPFTVRVPDVPGTASIALKRGSTVLAEKVFSANAPAVHVTSPDGGETLTAGEPATITWTAADADGDAVVSSVMLSTDGGTSWKALAVDTHGQSLSFTPSKSDVSDTALIRVMSSDGLNTGADSSDATFAIRPKTVPRASYGEPVLQAAIGEPSGFSMSGNDDNPSMSVTGTRVYKLRKEPAATVNGISVPARVYIDESTDGGATFVRHHIPALDDSQLAQGSALLGFAASGEDVYLAYQGASEVARLLVSHDGGGTWEVPKNAYPTVEGSFKELLVSGQDASMVFLTYHTGSDENVEVVSSHDGGRTLEAPKTLMTRSFNPYGHLWADAAVEGDRQTVVVYEEVTDNGTSPPTLKRTGLRVYASIDAGRNWLDPVTIDTEDKIEWTQVVPDGDDLHIKYEAPWTTATMNLAVVTSHDGGLTFGQPTVLSSGKRTHRRGFLDADGGTVAVQWGAGTEGSASDPARIMLAVSRDGGDSFGTARDITHEFGAQNPTAQPPASSRGVQVSGNNIYGLWSGALGDPLNGVAYVNHSILRVSTDFGDTWSTPRDLCNTTSGGFTYHGAPLWTAGTDFQAVGPDLYYFWQGYDDRQSGWKRYATMFRRGTGSAGGGIGVDAGEGQSVSEGEVIGFNARYSGASVDSTPAAVIDWGDGNTSPTDVIVSGGSGVVLGTHTYTERGTFAARVTVTDADEVQGVDETRVSVANAAPIVTPPAPLPEPTAGQAFGLNNVLFSDAGRGESFSAMVHWGDGDSSSGVVTVSPLEGLEGGTYGTVDAVHTYALPGTYEARVAISDGDASGEATMSITARANDAPTAAAGGPYEVVEGSVLSLDASASVDPDGDMLSYLWEAAGRTIGGMGYYSPWSEAVFADDYEGPITLSVADGFGGVDDDTTSLRVTNVAPRFFDVASRAVAVRPGDSVEATAAFADAGRLDTHEATLDWGDGSGPSDASVDETQGAGVARAAHAYSASGSYLVTARIADDDGAWSETTFTIDVELLNSPPVAADPKVSTPAGKPVAITLTASDPDGDPLTWSPIPVVAPVSGTLTGVAPKLTYTPKSGFIGTDVFAVQVLDGRGGSDVANVTVTVTPPATKVSRLSAADPYQIALESSRKTFPAGKTRRVVLASGAKWDDALSASGLAGTVRSPVLLTKRTSLTPGLITELRRLGAKRVYVVGNSRSVSTKVVSKLKRAGFSVTRISGSNRYEVAKNVALKIEKLRGNNKVTRALVVRGDAYYEAMTVSPIAYSRKIPILYTPNKSLSTNAAKAIRALDVDEVIIAGGKLAVSPRVARSIGRLRSVDKVTRWSGERRQDTSVIVAERAVGRGWAGWRFTGVTSALDWRDGLSASSAVGYRRGSLLMAYRSGLPGVVGRTLAVHRSEIQTVWLFGRTSTLTDTTLAAVRAKVD